MADSSLIETPAEKRKREKELRKEQERRKKALRKAQKEAAKLGVTVQEYMALMDMEDAEKKRKAPKKKPAPKPAAPKKETGGEMPPAKAERGERPPAAPEPAPVEEEEEEEYVSPVPWTRRSVEPMDAVQKRIDRMSSTAVRSLKDRYADKYGEDLTVPDLYEAKYTEIDGEKVSLYDEAPDDRADAAPPVQAPGGAGEEEKGGFLGRLAARRKERAEAKAAAREADGDEEEYEVSKWSLRCWMPRADEDAGKGKKIVFGLVGVVIYIIALVPRVVIGLPILWWRGRKARKEEAAAA